MFDHPIAAGLVAIHPQRELAAQARRATGFFPSVNAAESGHGFLALLDLGEHEEAR